MSQLMRRLTFIVIAFIVSGVFTTSAFAQRDDFKDGRLDQKRDAPIVLYCGNFNQGLQGFVATGGVAFSLSRLQIERAMALSVIDNRPVVATNGNAGAQVIVFPDRRVLVTAPYLPYSYYYGYTLAYNDCGGFSPDYGNPVTVLVDAVDVLLGQPPAGTVLQPQLATRTISPTTIIVTGNVLTHTVQRGENLFRIGIRYGVPYTQIAAANNIANPANIYVGQVLVIPQ